MKKAGGILGLIGGIFAVVAALVTLFLGGVGGALGAHGANQVIGLGFLGLLAAFLLPASSVSDSRHTLWDWLAHRRKPALHTIQLGDTP